MKTPEQEELERLRHRLVGLMYAIAGDVRSCSKGDRSSMTNTYSIVLAESLNQVEKVHDAYIEFFRTHVKKEKK